MGPPKPGNTPGEVLGPVSPGAKRAEAANPAVRAESPAELGAIDALQLVLDLAGMIPGAGAIPDLINAAISLCRGDFVGALFSAGSAIPVLGDAAGAAKILKNSDKYLEAAKVIEQKVLPMLPKSMRKRLEDYLKKVRDKIEELTKKDNPDAKPEPKKGEGNDNGGAKSTPTKRMKEKEVKCFKKNDKGDPKEYDRQLSDQERGLNDMSVKEYLEGRARYQEIGRQGTGAAQQKARDKYSAELVDKFVETLRENGVRGAAAQQQAAAMAADRMKSLSALHNPDLIAGGKDAVTSMGDKGVNSSIGSQWKDRVAELDEAAKEIPEHERGDTKMNAKLKRCK
jgi:hypothetical protein